MLEVMGVFVSGLLQCCRASSPQNPKRLWAAAACFDHTHLRYTGDLRYLVLHWLYLIPKDSHPELVLYSD